MNFPPSSYFWVPPWLWKPLDLVDTQHQEAPFMFGQLTQRPHGRPKTVGFGQWPVSKKGWEKSSTKRWPGPRSVGWKTILIAADVMWINVDVMWMFHVDLCGCVLVKSVECSKPSVIPLLVGALEHQFYFPFSWECHHPNWRTPSFFRGVGLNHQPAKCHQMSPIQEESIDGSSNVIQLI